MDKITRQILQLKNDLERQKAEQEKLLKETQTLIDESLVEIDILKSQNQQTTDPIPQQSPTPSDESSSDAPNNFYQGRVPSQEDLYEIAANPEKFGGFFADLDNWIDRDRAAQEAAPTHSDSKWFGGDRPQPSIEDMMNPKNFSEMLKELEQR